MKTSTKRILSILFSALFLMLTLVIYGSLIQPEMGNVSQLQSLVASKSNLYNSQKSAVDQVSTLISQFHSASQLQQTLGFAVPIGPNITQILNQWQSIASASQTNLQSLNVQSIQTAASGKQNQSLVKALNGIPVSVSAIGTYGGLKQFLDAVETNARVMNVQNFDFRSPTAVGQPANVSSSGGPIYSLQLDVDAFYQEN